MKLPLLLFLLLTTSTVFADNELDLMYEGNLQHQRKLSGLQFHLKTSRWMEGGYDAYEKRVRNCTTLFGYEHPTDFEESLAIRYDPHDADQPWRTCWVCEYPETPKEPSFKLRAFFVLDDLNLRTMVRPDYRLAGGFDVATHEDYFQAMTAGAQVLRKNYTRILHGWHDPASHVLFVNTKMFSIFEDPNGSVCRDVPWHIVEHGKFLGRDCVKMECRSEDSSESGYVVALAAPDFTVVEFNATETTSKGTFSWRRLTTTELGSYNGVTYPSAGTVAEVVLRSEEGDVWNLVTKFEIDSVKKIPREILAQWVPEIPPGTNLNVNDRITFIPFDERFRNSVFYTTAVGSLRSSNYSFVALVLLSLLGIVMFIVWKKSRNAI